MALTLGCGATPAPLQIRALVPAKVGVSDRGELRIEGQGFEPLITVDLDDRARTVEDTQFSARLRNASDTFALTVHFESTTQLVVDHPAALVPGSYALDLTAPDGALTTLASALMVVP